MSPSDRPLIYTNLGNMPVDELQLHVRWEETPEYVKLVEYYTLNGEIVRESAHALSRKGVEMAGENEPADELQP